MGPRFPRLISAELSWSPAGVQLPIQGKAEAWARVFFLGLGFRSFAVEGPFQFSIRRGLA